MDLTKTTSDYMTANNISARAAAKRIGISVPTLYRVLNGGHVGDEVTNKIAAATNTTDTAEVININGTPYVSVDWFKQHLTTTFSRWNVK
jgi:transcriptional regulator with XRE-family HTH domain